MRLLETLWKQVEDNDTVWTLQRVQEAARPGNILDTCGRLLQRLERKGVLIPGERRLCPAGW